MAKTNYRQAKRSREESLKKRKQEKMLRKSNRGAAGESATNAAQDVVDATNKVAP